MKKIKLISWWKHNNKVNLKQIKRENTLQERIKDLERELAVWEEVERKIRGLSTAQKRELGLLDLFEERKEK